MLTKMRVHAIVLARDVSQLVLYLRFRNLAGLYRLWFRRSSFGTFLADCRFRLSRFFGCGSNRCGDCGRFGLKGGTEVSAAVWAETDAFRQFLATTVAESGSGLGLAVVNDGIVPERCIRVIPDNEPAVLILAHGKTLRAHDLAVVNQQLLLGYGHPFSALWALEFHTLVA